MPDLTPRPGRQRGPPPLAAPAHLAGYPLSPLGESFANGPLAQLALWAEANQDELAGLPADGVRA